MVQPEREFQSLSDTELSQRITDTKRDIEVNRRSYQELKHWDGDRPGLASAISIYEAQLTRLYSEVEQRRIYRS